MVVFKTDNNPDVNHQLKIRESERLVTIPTSVNDGQIAVLREKAIELINDIAEALGKEGEDAQDDKQRMLDVAQDLRDMFFLVAIIGEFNAGKSSFVNAMIGENLLPMGITPTTEYIELIRYSEAPERQPVIREDLRQWGHPNTGAPGVAIVDTPGTGSVFEQHESTAKKFLHRSDLVIFVISAKRAFAETERLYMELARQYGKKIILVLNQVDLLEQKEQLEVRRFIEGQVKEKMGMEPLLFLVSAKEALKSMEAEGDTDETAGNLNAVKAHLRGVYSEAPPAKQKLLAQLDTVSRILQSYEDEVSRKSGAVDLDLGKVRDVQSELDEQSLGLELRMKEAGNEIDSVMEGIRKRGNEFIDTNLTVRKIGRGLDRQKLQDEFQDQVIGRSLRDISDAAGGYINAVVDQSRLYWRGVIDRLNQLQDLMEQEAGGLDASIYAEQRESLQQAIRIAETELKTYSSGQVVADMKKSFDTNMNGFQTSVLATVGGLVVAAVALFTPGPLVGATAAAFALPAFIAGGAVAVVAGIPAYRYLRRINEETKEEFNKRIDDLVKNYNNALDDLTKKERNRLTQYGNQILTPIFSRLEVMSKRYADQQERLDRFQREIGDLRGRVKELD